MKQIRSRFVSFVFQKLFLSNLLIFSCTTPFWTLVFPYFQRPFSSFSVVTTTNQQKQVVDTLESITLFYHISVPNFVQAFDLDGNKSKRFSWSLVCCQQKYTKCCMKGRTAQYSQVPKNSFQMLGRILTMIFRNAY